MGAHTTGTDGRFRAAGRAERVREYLACWKCLRVYTVNYAHECPHCRAPQPRVEVGQK